MSDYGQVRDVSEGKMREVTASDRDRWEAMTSAMYSRLKTLIDSFTPSSGSYFFLRQYEATRQAEEQDRREWIEGVKRRLGLVVSGEVPVPAEGSPPAVEWPAGVADGSYEEVSSHVVELPAGWPEGCRCVLVDGERVSLRGPCPVCAPLSTT